MGNEVISIFFVQFGTIPPENGQPARDWANGQALIDFVSDNNRAGCQIAKIKISTDGNFIIPLRLRDDLIKAKADGFYSVDIIPSYGLDYKKGEAVTIVKDYELVKGK